MTFGSLLKSFIDLDVENIAEQSLEETKDEAIGLNQDQLYAGLRYDESSLPGYQPATIVYKLRKGQVFDRMTLRDTGNFYESITAKARTGYLIIYAQDEKAPDLVERYGKILGLGGDYKKSFVEKYLSGNFKNKMEAATGLKYAKNI